jgi:hypothetical protein
VRLRVDLTGKRPPRRSERIRGRSPILGDESEFQVADAVAAKQNVANHSQHLHRTLQFAVRRTLGHRTLDEILAERVDIDESVAAEVRKEAETFACGSVRSA